MNPQRVIERYFESIRARDIDALSALYADDATFHLPNGNSFAGIAAIRDMHLGVFAAGSPFPNPVSQVIAEASAAVEIEARLADGSIRHTANFFYLNADGRIQRISVYARQH